MHFVQQIAVILPFSICNIQYFPVFTILGLSQISTTVRRTLSGGSRQWHCGQRLSFMFYVLCMFF